MDATRIKLRRGSASDFDFLWRLQREAMRPNVERQFGPWDEAFQRKLFDDSTNPEAHEIVELDGNPIGCQLVRETPDALELDRVHILPAFQNRGVGTYLLGALISRSEAANLPVRLQVFRTSPAKRLYARLGFRAVSLTETHEVMERAA